MSRQNQFIVRNQGVCPRYSQNACDHHPNTCTWREATSPQAKIQKDPTCAGLPMTVSKRITREEAQRLHLQAEYENRIRQAVRNRQGHLQYRAPIFEEEKYGQPSVSPRSRRSRETVIYHGKEPTVPSTS